MKCVTRFYRKKCTTTRIRDHTTLPCTLTLLASEALGGMRLRCGVRRGAQQFAHTLLPQQVALPLPLCGVPAAEAVALPMPRFTSKLLLRRGTGLSSLHAQTYT